jgi:hypothetical protein
MEVLRNPRILNNLDDAIATVVIQLALEELDGLLQEETGADVVWELLLIQLEY